VEQDPLTERRCQGLQTTGAVSGFVLPASRPPSLPLFTSDPPLSSPPLCAVGAGRLAVESASRAWTRGPGSRGSEGRLGRRGLSSGGTHVSLWRRRPRRRRRRIPLPVAPPIQTSVKRRDLVTRLATGERVRLVRAAADTWMLHMSREGNEDTSQQRRTKASRARGSLLSSWLRGLGGSGTLREPPLTDRKRRTPFNKP